MFGINFGNSPQKEVMNGPDEGLSNLDIRSILQSDGIIDEGHILNDADFDTIRNRSRIISSSHPGYEDEKYIELAFLDRAINSADALHVPYETATHNTDLASSLIGNPLLSNNEEFVNTVLTKAEDIYTTKKLAYSDALFQAIKERTEEFRSSGVSGKIDQEGTVTLN